MSAPAPLRLVVSRADSAPPLDTARAWRLAPPLATAANERPLYLAAAATLAIHAAVLGWMAIVPADDAARSAGAAEDLILLEGIPVEMVMSLPAPEAPPAEAPTPSEEPPPEPVEDPVDEPVAEEPVEPPVDTAVEPPQAEPEPEPPPVADFTLPPAETDAGELQARPEAAPPVADEPPPVADEPPRVEEPPPQAEEEAEPEASPPDPQTVPTPRSKPDRTPDRTEVARAEPKPEPARPAAPTPSVPSAPASAARSGGAGGGGSAATTGNAVASAYRAEVAAQLSRKRFYPSAGRRDRLTGRATVSFTLNASGRVTAARVVRSAGSRILDDAALEMVRRAAPYPPIPRALGTTITIQAPIGFELPR